MGCIEANNKAFFLSQAILAKVTAQSFIVYNDSLVYLTTYGFGLVEINTIRDTKRFITVSDGLPSQHLYEGYKGNDNNIWIASNYGIFSYNPRDKSVKSFLVADGFKTLNLIQIHLIKQKTVN